MSEHTQALKVVRKYFPNVKNVEDGEQPIQVEVTRQDTNSAAVRNHEACAMAVACKRLTKAKGVIVSIGTAYIIKGETALRYAVPPAVQREIVSFDREAGFAPGEYKLVPFRPSQRLGEPKASGPHKVSGKPRKTNHHTAGIRTVLGSENVR